MTIKLGGRSSTLDHGSPTGRQVDTARTARKLCFIVRKELTPLVMFGLLPIGGGAHQQTRGRVAQSAEKVVRAGGIAALVLETFFG